MKVLFLAANPTGTNQLSLDEEARAIEEKVRGAEHRDLVSIRTRWAVRPDDLQQVLLQDRYTVVHFSGHGQGEGGLVLHAPSQAGKRRVSADALADLFRVLKDDIRMVILNACYSKVQAQTIVQAIDFVVGMSDKIDDRAARLFAASFYRGLAFGRSVQTAFGLGINELKLTGFQEDAAIPELLVRDGVDAEAPLVEVQQPPRSQVPRGAQPTTGAPGLDDAMQRSLIQTLADLAVFSDPAALQTTVRAALRDAPRGQNFIRAVRFSTRPLDVARQLVVDGQKLGQPPGDFLARIIKVLLDEALDEPQRETLTTAFARLGRADSTPPKAGTETRPRSTAEGQTRTHASGRSLRSPSVHGASVHGEDEDEPSSSHPLSPLDVARQRHIEQWKTARDKRHERFIELELMPVAEGPMQPQPFVSLEALMNAVDEAAVLLVGAPGAGKTTLLRHLRYELSADDLGTDRQRVVFLLSLAEYPKRNPPGLLEWFQARFLRDHAGLGSLTDAWAAGDVWLLLDGLNEMPYGDDPRERFEDLRDALNALPRRNRVIVTCRAQDVAGSLGAVRRAEIKPLSEASVHQFLKKYAPDKAERARKDLSQKGLLELYQNPYRLSLLTDELLENGEIPANRAALFSSMVRRAFRDNLQHANARENVQQFVCLQARERIERGTLPPAHAPRRIQGDLLMTLSRMAFEGQVAGPGEHTRWSYDEALAALDEADDERAVALLKCGRAVLVLEEAVDGEVRFAHQQLQEYFAARYWVHTMDSVAFEQCKKGERVGDPKLGDALETIVAGLQPHERLPERPATGWEETAIMAVSLAASDGFVERLAAVDLVTAGRAALMPDSGVSNSQKDHLRQRIGACLRDPAMELRTRLDAGTVLDTPEVLGFERRRLPEGVEYLWPPMHRVPAGEYVIGSTDDDALAYDHEKPAHSWTLTHDVLLAQFAVTNAEFDLFMKAGGYNDERWWPDSEARQLVERRAGGYAG